MIDLDLLERAVKKVWYARTEDEDAAHSHVISELGILDLITRLRQAEQDAARYQWWRDIGRHSYGMAVVLGTPCSEEEFDGKTDENMKCK